MKKIGNKLKQNAKIITAFVLGAILTGGTVYAATVLPSSQVGYDNSTSGLAATDVQGALDELYVKANKCDKIGINTEGLSTLSGKFKGLYNNPDSTTCLDLSDWDTSAVMDMSSMFYGASSLTSLDLSNWDTSAVMDMNNMFCGASSLTSLDLSNWDTSAVTDMNYMFRGVNPNLQVTISCENTNLIDQINGDLGSGHYTCAN